MAGLKENTHGELLSVAARTTGRDKEADKIISLLGELDQRNLKIVYQFIKSLF